MMSESYFSKLLGLIGMNFDASDASIIHSNALKVGGHTLVYASPTIPMSLNFLCVGIGFLGAYMFICFCEQYRLSKMGDGKQKSKLLSDNAVFSLMTLSFAGVTTWGVTFISLAGLELFAPVFKTPVHINFLVWPTIIALVVACLCTYTALLIASRDTMFAKTKKEIVEKFVAHSSKLSFKEIQKISNLRMIFILSTQSMGNIVLGGIIDGSSTVICACLSFYSIKIHHVNVVYDVGVICGATVFSWFVSTLVYWILFRLLSLYPHMEWLRLASAFFVSLNLFVVGLVLYESLVFHIVTDPHAAPTTFRDTRFMSQEEGYNGVLIGSVCICFAMVLIAFSDLRMWLYAKSAKLESLHEILDTLKKESPQNADKIAAFMKRHARVHSIASHASRANNSSRHNEDDSSAATSNKGPIWNFFARCCGWNSVAPKGDDSQYESCIEGVSSRGNGKKRPLDSMRFVAPSARRAEVIKGTGGNAITREESKALEGDEADEGDDAAEEVRAATSLV